MLKKPNFEAFQEFVLSKMVNFEKNWTFENWAIFYKNNRFWLKIENFENFLIFDPNFSI